MRRKKNVLLKSSILTFMFLAVSLFVANASVVVTDVAPGALSWVGNSPFGSNYAMQTMVLTVAFTADDNEKEVYIQIDSHGGLEMSYSAGENFPARPDTVNGQIWFYAPGVQFSYWSTVSQDKWSAYTSGRQPIKCSPMDNATVISIEVWITMHNNPWNFDSERDKVQVPQVLLSAAESTLGPWSTLDPGTMLPLGGSGVLFIPIIPDASNTSPGSNGSIIVSPGGNQTPADTVWEYDIDTLEKHVDLFALKSGKKIEVANITASRISGGASGQGTVTVRFSPDDFIFYDSVRKNPSFGYTLDFGTTRIDSGNPSVVWDGLSPVGMSRMPINIQFDRMLDVHQTLDDLLAGTYTSTVRIEFITGT
ncbi:MAG: hypothetical protein SPD11_11575 [Sphaerochaetaceae bacterium]|nr:hypothetical protein [Sphaerochaetaceae bacterium]